MARSGNMSIDISVRGVGSVLRLPEKIERSRRFFQTTVGESLVFEIRRNIHSRSGRLSASWHAALLAGGGLAIRSEGTEYARASVRGAYINPKNKRALAFADGRFRNFARLNPGHYIGRPKDRRTSYVTLAFDQFRVITRAAWHLHFGELGR
jgi:hypothetical protein